MLKEGLQAPGGILAGGAGDLLAVTAGPLLAGGGGGALFG